MPDTRFCRPRRRLLAAAAATAILPWLVTSSAGAAELASTPSQPEGPFYPKRLPAERDADLLVFGGKRATGIPLNLSGLVRDQQGTPLRDALVEIWQCDASGRYHYVDDRGTAPPDENFQGYGQTVSDTEGRYRFRTIRPVPYPGRSPHIHFKVSHPGAVPLTTQLYVAGDRGADDTGFSRWYGKEVRERLTVTLTNDPTEAGALRGQFDIVLATRR
jgi:protocatechuate 3,4-dioxygenase beta subunit